jgi:hypothetical protein
MKCRSRVVRHALGGLALALLLGVLGVPESQAAGSLRTARQTYAPNEGIVVEFSGFPGNKTDWITVVQASAATNSYAEWFYTAGKKSGSLTFEGLPAGKYEARGYFNWSAGGYTVQARHSFTVREGAGEGAVRLKTVRQSYSPTEGIVVEFSGFPGNGTDWITVVPSYFPEGKYAEWFYTNGKRSGTMTFKALPEGEYEVRAYFNWPAGLYVVKARHTFTVR